eukprot:jgi/Ulvmu1/12903/UM098_0091.1
MVHVWDDRATLWLPAECVQDITNNEDDKFARLVRAVRKLLSDACSSGEPSTESLQQSIAWADHISRYMRTKTRYLTKVVSELYDAVFQFIIATCGVVTVNSRWLGVARLILSTYRNELLSVKTFDLEPYWTLLHNALDHSMSLEFDGNMRISNLSLVAELCKQARSYFPPTAASIVWDRLKEELQHSLSPVSLSAVAKLLIFFPHRSIHTDKSLPWNEWASDAVKLWRTMSQNSYWDSMWMCFLARLAKHDRFGVIDWPSILPYICSNAIWQFRVPVGNAAAPQQRRIAPRFPLDIVAGVAIKRNSSVHAHLAKLLMYTLTTNEEEAEQAEGRLTALQGLTQLATLFEHFFHASNTGPWCDQLSDWLDTLSWYLMRRRLPAEASDAWQGSPNRKLNYDRLGPVVTVLLKLAQPAMYHKNGGLRSASLEVLSNAAYLQPDTVLPLVVQRFQEALAASNSVHQISSSIRALSACVRPMLLHGLVIPKSNAEPGLSPHGLACQEIATAMMLLLPGLDANDQSKSEATLAFYLSVFGNCVTVRGLDAPPEPEKPAIELPLYLCDFVPQFIQQLFGVIDVLKGNTSAVDSADGAGVSLGSWISRNTYLRPLAHEIFQKIPEAQLLGSAKQIATYVLALSEPQPAFDAGHVIEAATVAFPNAACSMMLDPVLKLIEEDVENLAGDVNPSQSATKRVHAHLVVLSYVVQGLHGGIASRARNILELMLSVTRIPDALVVVLTSRVLSTTFNNLACLRPLPIPLYEGVDETGQVQSMGVAGSLNNAVARWAPKACAGCPKLHWSMPVEEHVELAMELMQACVQHARKALAAMQAAGTLADSKSSSRHELRRLQTLMSVVARAVDGKACSLATSADAAAASKGERFDICVPAPARQISECSLLREVLELSLEIIAGTDTGNVQALSVAMVELERLGGAGVANQARSYQARYGTVKSRDRRWNEPVFADRLLGLEPGALGSTPRQPYWAASKVVSQAYLTRLTLRASSPNATMSNPELNLTKADPLAQKAISVLVQLSFHRYSAVATRASRGIAALMPICTSLGMCLLPALASRLALMDPTASSAGVVPEEVAAEGGYSIPLTQDAAEELLQEHMQALDGLIGSADSQAGFVERCTSDNKHMLLGALGLLDALRAYLPMTVSLHPSALMAVFSSMMLLQSYSLLDVKLAVNRTIASFGVLFSRPSYAQHYERHSHLQLMSRMLLTKLQAGAFHWRSIILTHAWFVILMPVCSDIALLREVVQLQLQHAAQTDMLFVKDMAVSSLLLLLDSCLRPDADKVVQKTVFECVREAAADKSWSKCLVTTLNDLHSAFDGVNTKTPIAALQSLPEASLLLLLHQPPVMARRHEGTLHLSPEPQGPSKDPSASQRGPLHGISLRLTYFLEALMRIAPESIIAAVQGPAVAFSKLPPEKQALEASMEYTVVEICIAAMCSGAAFAPCGPGGTTPWLAWVQQVLQESYSGAPQDRCAVVAYAVARTVRFIGNEAVGTLQYAPEVAVADVEGVLNTVTEEVCRLVGAWSGNSASDTKHAQMLVYAVDLLMQLQSERPSPIGAASLQSLLSCCRTIVPGSASHPLQTVRLAASTLILVYLGAIRSSMPLMENPEADRARKDSLSGEALQSVTETYASAQRALEAARASHGPGNGSAMDTDVLEGGAAEVEQWESSIGYAAGLTSTLTMCTFLTPMLHDVALVALPWVIDVQSLQHAQLQGLTLTIRRVIVLLKNFTFEKADVQRVVAIVLHALELPAWQARGSALSFMQSLWFRNFFALRPEELQALVQACDRCLQDDKLEIRSLAGVTLSGLLKVIPPVLEVPLRNNILQQGRKAFPAGRMQHGPESTVMTQHSCVIRLAALLSSSPYTICDWMDEVLMMIARAARRPAPVRTAATAALGEFRKTHETSESEPLKERLKPEIWEGIMDVTLQTSYFA